MKPLDDNDFVQAHGHAAFDPLDGLVPSIAPVLPANGNVLRPSAQAPPPSLPAALAIGSDAEVARHVLDVMRGGGEPIVFDRGAFHRYDPETGIWQALRRVDVECVVHEFDGLKAEADGKLFKANQYRVLGAVARAAAIASDDGFFAGATAGLVFANGFLSVSADGARLVPHAPEHRATARLAMPYDAGLRAPRFERFLHEVFAPDSDAAAKIELVQQFVGACLVGLATRFQAALVLVGEGANGKSVLIDVVKALFTADTLTAISPQDFGQEYRRALLAGSRLNAVSEMPEREMIESEAFKAIISGDLMTARHIRESPFTFRSMAGHLFAANGLPGTRDQSHGFWRRLLLVEFRRVFAPHEQDKTLAQTIIANELPGVAAWAIEGAVAALRQGRYTMPASVVAARDEWQRTSDQVRLFADDRLVPSQESKTAASVIYGHYSDWAKANGHHPLASNKFFPRLMALDLGIERRRSGAANYYTCALRRAIDDA
jgi:putative DNA primase/helicase